MAREPGGRVLSEMFILRSFAINTHPPIFYSFRRTTSGSSHGGGRRGWASDRGFLRLDLRQLFKTRAKTLQCSGEGWLLCAAFYQSKKLRNISSCVKKESLVVENVKTSLIHRKNLHLIHLRHQSGLTKHKMY